jgi:hypothetical protein
MIADFDPDYVLSAIGIYKQVVNNFNCREWCGLDVPSLDERDSWLGKCQVREDDFAKTSAAIIEAVPQKTHPCDGIETKIVRRDQSNSR